MPAPGPPGASAGAPTGPSAAPEALATASPRQVQMTQTIQERLQALDKQLGTMVERGPLPVETDAAKVTWSVAIATSNTVCPYSAISRVLPVSPPLVCLGGCMAEHVTLHMARGNC